MGKSSELPLSCRNHGCLSPSHWHCGIAQALLIQEVCTSVVAGRSKLAADPSGPRPGTQQSLCSPGRGTQTPSSDLQGHSSGFLRGRVSSQSGQNDERVSRVSVARHAERTMPKCLLGRPLAPERPAHKAETFSKQEAQCLSLSSWTREAWVACGLMRSPFK